MQRDSFPWFFHYLEIFFFFLTHWIVSLSIFYKWLMGLVFFVSYWFKYTWYVSIHCIYHPTHAQMIPSLVSWIFFKLVPKFFGQNPSSFPSFPCYWYDKLFPTHLINFLPHPESALFPRGLLFYFWWKIEFTDTIRVLEVLIAVGLVLVYRLF